MNSDESFFTVGRNGCTTTAGVADDVKRFGPVVSDAPRISLWVGAASDEMLSIYLRQTRPT